MGAKNPSADKAFQQEVTITNTQAHVFDSLRGLHGSTRGDVMNALIQLGLQHLKGKRSVDEAMQEAKRLREAAPDVAPTPRSQRKKAPESEGGAQQN